MLRSESAKTEAARCWKAPSVGSWGEKAYLRAGRLALNVHVWKRMVYDGSVQGGDEPPMSFSAVVNRLQPLAQVPKSAKEGRRIEYQAPSLDDVDHGFVTPHSDGVTYSWIAHRIE